MNRRRNDNRIYRNRAVLYAALFSALTFAVTVGTLIPPAAAQGPSERAEVRKGERKKTDKGMPRIPMWNQKAFRERLERLPEKERQGVELMQRMVLAQISQPFIAREITLQVNGKETEQWVRWNPTQGMRRESIRPVGEIFIDNLKQSYFFQTKERRWIQRDTIMPRPQGRIADVMRRLYSGELRATLDGQDTIAGRAADIVRVEPQKNGRGPSRRFWVDRSTGLRLKAEEIGGNGRLLSSSYYLSLDLTPKFRDEDFAPPPNPIPAEKIRGQRQQFRTIDEARKAGYNFRQPTYIPSGFDLLVVDAFGDAKHTKGVTLRYRNGITLLSLSQMRAEKMKAELLNGLERNPWKGRFADGPRGGGERAYMWRDNDIVYILLGTLSDDETRRIAASVK
jgi:hypothetical protein